MAVVSVDYIASDVAGRSQKVGELPEGVVPVLGIGTSEKVYIAPLGYRGSGGGGGYIAVYSTGSIYIWTETTNEYYFGQVVFPVNRA